MAKEKVRHLLAGLGLAGLVAGASLAAPGSAFGSSGWGGGSGAGGASGWSGGSGAVSTEAAPAEQQQGTDPQPGEVITTDPAASPEGTQPAGEVAVPPEGEQPKEK